MEEKLIRDAQYRKGLSIAYFNSLNASIELAKVMFPDMEGVDVKSFIKEWRDYFLEEHKTYYANVIANAGKNYDAKKTIGRLKEAKTIDELRDTWRSLSEDERRDGEIKSAVNEMKKTYEKA